VRRLGITLDICEDPPLRGEYEKKKKEKDNRGNEEKKKSSQHSGYKQTSRAKEVGCVR
jgi:hypothetical protein